MANNLSIAVGANTATIPLAGTNAKINALISRYLSFKEVDTASMTATQIGEAFLTELKKDAVIVSRNVQQAQLRNANEATISQTVESDNAL